MGPRTVSCKIKANMTRVLSISTHSLALNLCLAIVLSGLHMSQACDQSRILQDETVLKKMITQANIAVKGLITNTYNDEHSKKKDAYIAEVWLLDVYKGIDNLDESMGIPKEASGPLTVKDK